MLSSIHIEGFKGFKDTRIEPIRKVNLILGGQNVGKTSLLEAVYLGASDVGAFQNIATVFRMSEGNDSRRYAKAVWEKKKSKLVLANDTGYSLAVRVNYQRDSEDGFFSLDAFGSGDVRASRVISGADITDSVAQVALSKRGNGTPWHLPTDALLKMVFLNPLAVSIHLPQQVEAVRLFDRVVMIRKKRLLLDMLKRIEPRLEDMHSLSPDGEQRIYVELVGEDEALPLPLLGHGFSRLVHLYCSLLVTESKLALIDEVENGIHYSSLPTLFQGIQDIAANNDVQTLMTTHSWECIRAAYNTFAAAGKLEDFQLIRLERDADNVKAIVINDEQLVTVMEAGYEIR
ncbi:AAA family ATPase [Curvibacter sp. CHRR-16]|uniref:AAA family ATPase n=1 Tax=Curvibacter sp. CHRR-16 TaxID=2835872 RepID=UPI001BDA1E9D|nr:AAA family ATPase [Curvibacter sp. CHRR-16]MBT0569224.1 AAA family ATPase [Curvibacter sp. CHRR-16]